ncbi:MAG: DUF981 domain-containing protein [Phycisphaerae bacterium]|nr:DUF981 domain-containing protein [Phycisphaerae bacterium]
MPWNDYITLLLINMAAGMFVLGGWLICAAGAVEGRHWAPAFGAVGAVAGVTGAAMVLTWPVRGAMEAGGTSMNLAFANVAFGEPTVLLGVAFLAAAVAIGKGWPVWPVAIYGAVAGLAGIVIGMRILHAGLTQAPIVSAVGFIATGVTALLTLPALACASTALRRLTGILAILTGLFWGFSAVMAYWIHVTAAAKLT